MTYSELDLKEPITYTKTELFTFWEKSKASIYSNISLWGTGFLFIFFSIFRLVSALIWALIFFIIGLVLRIKNFTFGVSYLSILSFYPLILVVDIIALKVDLSIPYSTFVILGIFIGLNFLDIKNNQVKSV